MGTTRFNWESLRDWVKTAEDKKCKKCQVPEHDTCGNSADCPCCRDSRRESTVRRSDLTKVGGLFRVRDDYETVWKMEAGEDGRSYITRLGEEGTEERVLVSEDDSSENYSKTAYRTIKEGLAHIVWECEECSTPNITKEGNKYECDGCHHQFPEVLSHNPKPEVYDRSAVAELCGDWAVDKMRREGVSKINKDLLNIWIKEAGGADCPQCGDYVDPQFKERHKKNCPGAKAAAKTCSQCSQPIKNGKCQCSWANPPKEG